MNNDTNVPHAKILMLWPDATEDIPSIISQNYKDLIHIDSLYKKSNLAKRFIRKILSILNLSTIPFCGKWIERIHDFNTIIIHANIINRSVPRMLRKREYKGRIIYWYWNPVHMSISPQLINRNYCELWSFSEDDCIKYNLQHNSTYYFLNNNISNKSTTNNIFFCGKDKNRYNQLIQLKLILSQIGYNADFAIIQDKTSPPDGIFSSYMSYHQIISRINESCAIVEILQEGQTGFSLRVMESIFFQKKLITNNNSLVNAPFYNRRNIFILGIDNVDDLSSFLKEPFEKSQINWIEYFDFKNWLQRFDNIE